MISRLLDAARARAQMADAVAKTDETLTLRLRDGEVVAAHTSEQAGHNLRVVVDGRIGVAGTTGARSRRAIRGGAGLGRRRRGGAAAAAEPVAAPAGPDTCAARGCGQRDRAGADWAGC